ncbi:MAG: sigma-70 family RNA polymerase sigma factor [Candidatus Omnitrophica bacterium]|nr:sigma-70 family RNA polymerase sigma factor [Candidatus Omnitrophota bacterium]
MTTEELLTKCVNHNRDAWNIFIKRYKTLVTKSVRYKMISLGVTFSQNESRDIVQQIFLELWTKNKLKKLRKAVCLENWLTIVSLNTTLNYCKEKTFRNSRKLLSLEKDLCRHNAGHEKILLNKFLSDEKFDGTRLLESHETLRAITREISKLEYRRALILKLNIYHGKTQKDIAQIMDIPAGTVATLIKRSKELLRTKLREFYENR